MKEYWWILENGSWIIFLDILIVLITIPGGVGRAGARTKNLGL
jgi:hypothetical protein